MHRLRPLAVTALALGAAFLLATAFAIVAGTVSGIPFELETDEGPMSGATFSLLAAASDVSLLVIAILILRWTPGEVPFAWRGRFVLASIGAFAAVLAINGVGSFVASALGETYTGVPDLSGPWGVVAIVVAATLAPAAEELFFREALLIRVFGETPRPVALAVTSLVFGLLHAPAGGPILVLSLAGMGFVLGVLRLRTGSLAAPILVHGLNNLMALAAARALSA